MVAARTVLWYLTFCGFAINYMIRINLSITIVDMVITNTTATNETAKLLSNGSQTPQTTHESNRFAWNEVQRNDILGSFYWLHWTTQIPGGILARRYGTKLIFGGANVIGAWLCFVIPIVSFWDYRCLIFVRILQGLVTGLAWPAMHALVGKWIPPNERSKFVTAYLGCSVGIAAFFPIFGYMMHWLSWEWVFYVGGVLGTVWWLGWLYFVYNTPEEHPRIDKEEVAYIAKSLGATVHQKRMPTPWPQILRSRALWINAIAQFGGIWGLFTIMTQAPTYLKYIHKWNIRAVGILSGLPHAMRMLYAYVFSMLADYLLRSNKLSRTNVRKLATASCCIINGLMWFALAYFGYDANIAIVFIVLSTMFHGSVTSGPLASLVDLSPNYAGILLGICGMFGTLPGFISPIVVAYFTKDNQTVEAWTSVFVITGTILVTSGIIYVLCADSKLQGFNNYKQQQTKDAEKELQLLNADAKS